MTEFNEELAREVSPFRRFGREEWALLRADTPMTLSAADVEEVKSFNEKLDVEEVETVYLPLSRLLNLYVQASQKLFNASNIFLHRTDLKVPYVIGVAGSVASGKSTTARVLRTLLSRWPSHPKVDLVTTDGFLFPNAVLEKQGLMNKKGFPESYDLPRLLRFLSDLKSGERDIEVPVYSHQSYDVLPGETHIIDQPDILIVEGINVLQTGRPPQDGRAIPNVSDFFDFSIFIDAEEADLRHWYVSRFIALRDSAFKDPEAYFHRYASLNDAEAVARATAIWEEINLVNLQENILPTRPRADLVLRKRGDHHVKSVYLRKL